MSTARTHRPRWSLHEQSHSAPHTVLALALVLGLGCHEATAPPDERPVPIARVRLSIDSATLMEGETLQLTVQVTDSTGTNLTDRELLLYSLNPTVAQVSQSGLVEARSRGRALIVARSEGVRDTALFDVQILFRCLPQLWDLGRPPNVLLGRGIHGPAGRGERPEQYGTCSR